MDAPDYFRIFGLEPRLSIDLPDLERLFYQLSREVHPDRFQRATAAAREKSLEATTTLNDAYRTLRDSVKRAEYLLKVRGFEPAEPRQAPPDLLEEVFELNETLEEARAGAADARQRLDAARTRFNGLLAQADADLDELAQSYDSGDTSALAGIRRVLDRRRYISNLLAQVESETA